MWRFPFILAVTLALVAGTPWSATFASSDGSASPPPPVTCSNGIPGGLNCITSKKDLKDARNAYARGLKLQEQKHLPEALAKFDEANKYAPNWGRLHLKWGEALFWLGKKDEARKQFSAARGLDLTTTEKAELAAAAHG